MTGYDAMQHQEKKGDRKRPETMDLADRSVWSCNSARNEPVIC
jgi:hypothetical protein